MANTFYTNNFRGRAGRRERAKHLVDEFKAIEDAFTELQAYNIATYLTIYTNLQTQGGTITIYPDNGYLQELFLLEDSTIILSAPLNESQYRVSLLIHGANFKVVNGWGAQTWKEYGSNIDNWWELYTAEGPYASMLLDFWWDICSHTWVCVASSKNLFNTAGGAGAVERFYPLLCNLSNIEGDDTWSLTRAGNGQSIDHNETYHYLSTNMARHHGVRWVENWCPTASDLLSLAWVPTDTTPTIEAAAGPIGEDVHRLSFDVQGGKLGMFILPSFGRAATDNDSIKISVSFKAKAADVTAANMRVIASLCGKTSQSPPVHDQFQIAVTDEWVTYGGVLDILKEGNDPKSFALDQYYPKTLTEIAFMSPSGEVGDDILITDVNVQVLRAKDAETVSEHQESVIGSSIALIGNGTGSWVDGTKTLTLATVGQSVDLSETLEEGRTYLVHPRLQNGDAADIRMQNSITVWGAGPVSDSLYVQDAPFTFQYDGGELSFVLLEGVSSVYLVDIYKVSNEKQSYCYENPFTVVAGNVVSDSGQQITYDTGVLLGVAREIASTNEIPYTYFRTFTLWDQVGLSGIDVNDCRNPVFQSEYGIDGWPSRATILQGASRVTDGFIQREWSLTPSTESKDFQMWIRRTIDVEGNQVYEPQAADVNVPVSRYVDFEAELDGGGAIIESGRVRLDVQNASFEGLPSGYNYELGIYALDEWYLINIALQNDGTHDTFRVRVYPASGTTADPSQIDESTQGWVIIDWAQFETTGGTFVGSSPIIGGETRNTEDFATAMPDGEIFATYQDGSFLDEPNKKVADVTAGAITWLTDDYVWRNLIYSTTSMGSVSPYNMHEFGLVEETAPPQDNFEILTTTLYPIEVIEGVEIGASIVGGELIDHFAEELDGTGYELLDAQLTQILITSYADFEEVDGTGYQLLDAVMTQILLTGYADFEEIDGTGYQLLDAWMESKLITALAPTEGLDTGCTLIGGSLDDI